MHGSVSRQTLIIVSDTKYLFYKALLVVILICIQYNNTVEEI